MVRWLKECIESAANIIYLICLASNNPDIQLPRVITHIIAQTVVIGRVICSRLASQLPSSGERRRCACPDCIKASSSFPFSCPP